MKKFKFFTMTAAAAALAFCLAGCGAKITGISLPAEIELEKGETKALAAEALGGDASPEEIEKALEKLGEIAWTTSDEDIATVDENGNVTAVGKGKTEISAKVGDFTAACAVNIKVSPDEIKVPEKLELKKGDEADLEAKVLPEDADEVELTYETSDETVATVDETGKVTATGTGECVVTASAEKLKAETKVTVEEEKKEAPPEN